jgi:N-acetylneuraminate synthase
MTAPFHIGRRSIGPGLPAYIVAEMSANHLGDYARAEAIVRAARAAGADAIKLQTYTADTITLDSTGEQFHVGKGTIWEGRTLHALYREAETPWEWQPRLKALANELGLDCFSSPFDETAVDFLERMGVPAYKIASFEIVDLPLIARVARTGKPIIFSTGIATLAEIEEAVRTARAAGAAEIALLHCVSAYPARPEEMNLRTIADLHTRFGVPAGLSDHTLGVAVPVAAVSLGACIIEKHLTISRSDGGPDGAFSLEPHEFKEMVEAVRVAECAIGAPSYGAQPREQASRAFRRSLFVVREIAAGEVFSAENVKSIRPGHGLHTRYLEDVVGRRATRSIRPGTPLSWDLIEGGGQRP